MSAPCAGSLAERVARQLGLDAGGVTGTGPDGSTTLADVLRQAGRPLPAAARPPRPRAVYRTGEEEGRPTRRMEIACDAKPIRDACHAFAALSTEPPGALELVARLCGTALRDHPGLAEAFVVRPLDASPGGAGGDEDSPAEAVLTIAERSGSIRLGLEFAAGSEAEGEAFLDRLRTLCLDPRRALL